MGFFLRMFISIFVIIGAVSPIKMVYSHPLGMDETPAGYQDETVFLGSHDNAGIAALLVNLEKAFKDKDINKILSCFDAEDMVFTTLAEEGDFVHVHGLNEFASFLHANLGHPENEVAQLLFLDGTTFFTLRQDNDVAEMLSTRALRVQSIRNIPSLSGEVEQNFLGFRYRDGQWRICFIFPRFVESRVVVTDVLPGGQASKLGLRIGDIVTHSYRMHIFDSEQLIWRTEMFFNRPKDTKIRILVRRGKEQLSFNFNPGDMGIRTRNVFEGRVDTLTLTGQDAAKHPGAKTIERYHQALREGRSEGVASSFCPSGFVFIHGLPSFRTARMIGPKNAQEIISQELSNFSGLVRPETFKVTDLRFVQYADTALAGWHVFARKNDGTSINEDVIACLVRVKDEWLFVGMPWQDRHRLGLCELPPIKTPPQVSGAGDY